MVERIATEAIQLTILDTSPLILHFLSKEARHNLVLPPGRKTQVQKQITQKHNLLEEFRSAAHYLPDGDTLLCIKAKGIKDAMLTAALDLPGARKAQIGRLVWVLGDYVPVYGIPYIYSTDVRNSDINRTRDMRTRPIIPRWTATVTITYVAPLLTPQAVTNLLVAGGVTAGVGDWRPEKGNGNYGQFEVRNPDDPEVLEIMRTGGRDAQTIAMENPEPYDEDTAELLSWYKEQVARLGR